MKQFFEQYGAVVLGILALLVLIAMITPVGNIVKTSLQGTAHKFSSSINSQTDTMTSDMEKMLENSMYVSEYAKEVLSKQRLYDVGEQNLTVDDIVTINGIDCYVLEATATTAKLITKDIYDVRFDTGGHNAEDVEGHVGSGDYVDKTYDYKYSTLRTWMSSFYRNELGASSKIQSTTVTYYTLDDYASGEEKDELNNYAISILNNEFVFPLDTKEAQNNATYFNWNYTDKMGGRGYGFWTTAGYKRNSEKSRGFRVGFDSSISNNSVNNPDYGARPVFWITLE